MPTISVEPELYEQLEAVAQAEETRPEAIAQEAFRLYLWEQSHHKIAQESAAYHERHAELKEQYLGQYIAMHQGEVVDHDADFQSLYQRVRQRYGKTPVMLTQVGEEPEVVLMRRGFRSDP